VCTVQGNQNFAPPIRTFQQEIPLELERGTQEIISCRVTEDRKIKGKTFKSPKFDLKSVKIKEY
jgi:hypothetical protein